MLRCEVAYLNRMFRGYTGRDLPTQLPSRLTAEFYELADAELSDLMSLDVAEHLGTMYNENYILSEEGLALMAYEILDKLEGY